MVSLCFKERSSSIKCLVFLISVLIMILVALALILVNRNQDNHVCKSEQCISLSAQLIRHADRSVNPCDDFHAFTCGGYIKNRREFPPPPPEEEMNAMIKEMVQSEDSKPFIMQKSFYLACSNFGGIENNNDETILNLLFSLGDWPVIRGSHWQGTVFDWTEVAKTSRRLGSKFDWFLDFSIYEDVNGTGLNILKIDIPPLTPLNESEIGPRGELLTKVAIALGAPGSLAHYETGTVIRFENNLRTLAERHRKRKKHLTLVPLPKNTINEVQVLWPSIQWLELINNITGLRMIGSDYVIFDEVIDYIEELNRLIYGTPKRIVADYMMWKIIEEWWPYLSQLVREKFERFYEKYYNSQPEVDRQKFCVNESRKLFPLIVESEYIRRHVTQQKKQLVKEMLFIIRNKFTQLVDRATGLNRELKYHALNKLQKMEFMVGGPRQIFDEFGFAEDLGLYGFVFKSTNVIDMLTDRRVRFYDSYFGSVNRVVSNATLKFYEKVVNITRFTVINGNTLVIPAAVLRDAVYNPNLPNYFNYASLGKILAQEIFNYAFELNNQSIFEDYSTENTMWMSELSDAFEPAVRCMIRESSYVHNSDFRRQKKMQKFLADFIAPEIAYESYKEWALMFPQESKLPVLEFTPSQLFWIHTSKLSCNKIYSKHDRDYSRFKVIGPLRNSRNFAADYNCTEGSLMYAKKHCRIL